MADRIKKILAEVVISLFDTLGMINVLGSFVFAVLQLDNLPKYGPEEMNLATVVEKQVAMETKLVDDSAAVSLQ